jgi:hypothetical protein
MLQDATRNDPSFPTQNKLKEYITNNMTTKSTFLAMERNRFHLASSSFGISACLGELSPNTSKSIRQLHDYFFSKLIEIFSNVFDIIELTVYRMSNTLLTIAAEENEAVRLPKNTSSMDQNILDLIPQLLQNTLGNDFANSDFDDFFTKNVNNSQDLALFNVKTSRSKIEALSSREKSILLTSLLQFDLSIRKRLLALTTNILNSTSLNQGFPNTFLFSPDQTAFSFKRFVQNILQTTNDEIVLEYFLIIQNQKNTLLQNTAGILGIPHNPVHLSRATFSAMIRSKPAKISTVLSVNSISNVNNRPKRSWGGFWGGAFSLATQEDMDKILKHELNVDDNELKISNSLWNVTVTNSKMINSLKAVTSGIDKLVHEEQDIFDQIDSIMESEQQSLQQLNELVDMVDKSTTLIADYQLIQLQIGMLIHLTDKVKALVNAILTHTVDTTQIPLSLFKPHLQDNLKITLRLADYKLKSSAQGTILNIQMPVLSNPYFMYTFRIVPFYLNDTWYQPTNPIDFALNSIEEVLNTKDTLTRCTKIHDDYACDSRYALVYKYAGLEKSDSDKILPRHKNELLCAVRTLKSIESPKPSIPFPCGVELSLTLDAQRYIIKGNKLVLASPIFDELTSKCKHKKE